MKQKVLAVTGGIAEGKSTIVGFLSSLGFSTWSADEVVRRLWSNPDISSEALKSLNLPPEATKAEIVAALGASQEKRRALNQLFHPLVLRDMELSNAEVYEVPLLIESCLQKNFLRVWVAYAGESVQRQRMAERGLTEEAAEAILAAQLPTRAKTPFADQEFRTNLSRESVSDAVTQAAMSDEILRTLLRQAPPR